MNLLFLSTGLVGLTSKIKILDFKGINPNVTQAEYAVRGELNTVAEQLKEVGCGSYPYRRITRMGKQVEEEHP